MIRDAAIDEETKDLKIVRGDFLLEESDQRHIETILLSNKGHFFESPLLGVAIVNEIKSSSSTQNLKQQIRRQLVLDGYNVRKIDISEDYIIDIDAKRNE